MYSTRPGAVSVFFGVRYEALSAFALPCKEKYPYSQVRLEDRTCAGCLLARAISLQCRATRDISLEKTQISIAFGDLTIVSHHFKG